MFAADAGYRSWSYMAEEVGDDDIRIVEINHREMLLNAMEASSAAGDIVAAAALQIALDGEIKEATAEIMTDAQRAEALEASRDLSWLK